MEIKIINEFENKLFGRKEIKGTLDLERTPSRFEVLEFFSKKYSVPLENIKVKEIKGKFGVKIFDVKVNIYDSKEDKEKFEVKKKKETDIEKRLEEEAKAKEAPKEDSEEGSEEKSEEVQEVKNEEKSE